MLHEILLALIGHYGDIIVPITHDKKQLVDNNTENYNIIGFEVANGLDFIPKAEKQLLNEIVKMGYYYRCIEEFIESHQSLRVSIVSFHMRRSNNNNNNDNNNQSFYKPKAGLYVRALCVGLDEFLDGYRAALLKTEQDILAEPHHQYPLAKLRVSLRNYSVVLPHLKEFIDEVQGVASPQSLHGGEILQRLYRRSLVGIPYVQTCMKRLLFHCNSVLFHQISAWIVNGLVTDPYNEFFIEDTREDSAMDMMISSSSTTTPNDDQMSVYSVATTASTSSAGTSVGDASRYGGNNAQNTINWSVCFRLRINMLATSYFPVALANKILFVGKSVCILQHAQTKHMNSHIDIETGTATQKHAPLLPHTDALTFARAIHNLREKSNFDLLSVNQAIDAMRVCVNKHLWNLVVVEARLYDHLKALKDFYLVGRGEFFQCFIEAIDDRHMFHLSPSLKVERDLNDGPFQLAAQQLNMEDDDIINRLVVRLDKTSFNFPHFTSKQVCRYGDAGTNVVVTNGVTKLNDRCIRLSGNNSNQIGSVWYDSRKTVSRGFATKFRFQLTQKSSPPPPLHHSTLNQLLVRVHPTEMTGKRAAPWSWGHGFSFVVQNFSLLATPNITSANLNIYHSNNNNSNNNHHDVVSKENILQGAISSNTRVTVTNESKHITGIALDRHHSNGVRNNGIVNSLEVYFHISILDPASNHVCLYARAPTHTQQQQQDVDTKMLAHSNADDGITKLSTASLAHLSDGGEHIVKILYKQPSNVTGKLYVFVDDMDTPALVHTIDLESFMKLDDGRAYVGFTSVTGYTPLTPSRRERRTMYPNIEYNRDIISWDFTEGEGVASNAWRKMRLEYKVEAPLDLLLLNEDFDRYNALFGFLFLTKRTQLKLQSTWPLLMNMHRIQQNIDTKRKAYLLKTMTALRHKMQFFIDNLQYYLQVDVLEVEYEALLKKIKESKDFETVYQAHHEYLNRLSNLCFRSQSNIARCLNKIFDTILEYCEYVSHYTSNYDNDGEAVEKLTIRMNNLTEIFEKQSEFLYNIIGPQSSYYSAPHLAQLVLRLDYNKFFSEKSEYIRTMKQQRQHDD